MAFDFSNLDCSKVKVDTWGSKPNGNDCYWNIAKNQLGTDATNAEIARLTAELQQRNGDKEMLYIDDEVLVTAETALQSISNNLTSATDDLNNFQNAANTAQDALTTASGEVASTLATFNSISIPEPAYKEEKGENGKTVKTQTNANEIADAKAQKEAAQKAYQAALEREKAAKEQVEAAKNNLESAKNKLENIKNEYKDAKNECDNAELEADKNKQKMDEIDKQIADLENQLDDAKQKAAEMDEQKKVAENNQNLGNELVSADFSQDKLEKAVSGTSAVMFNTNDKGEITETKLDAKGNISTYKVTKNDEKVKNSDKTNTKFTLTAAENATSSKNYGTTIMGREDYEKLKGKIGSDDKNDIKQYDIDGDGKITYADSIVVPTFTDDNFDELFGASTDKKDTTSSGANSSDDKKTKNNDGSTSLQNTIGIKRDGTFAVINGKIVSKMETDETTGEITYKDKDGNVICKGKKETSDKVHGGYYNKTTITLTDNKGNNILEYNTKHDEKEATLTLYNNDGTKTVTTTTYKDKLNGETDTVTTTKYNKDGSIESSTTDKKATTVSLTEFDGNKIDFSTDEGKRQARSLANQAVTDLAGTLDMKPDELKNNEYIKNILDKVSGSNCKNGIQELETVINYTYKLNAISNGEVVSADDKGTNYAALQEYLKNYNDTLDLAKVYLNELNTRYREHYGYTDDDGNKIEGNTNVCINIGKINAKYDDIVKNANNIANEFKNHPDNAIAIKGWSYTSSVIKDFVDECAKVGNNGEDRAGYANKYKNFVSNKIPPIAVQYYGLQNIIDDPNSTPAQKLVAENEMSSIKSSYENLPFEEGASKNIKYFMDGAMSANYNAYVCGNKDMADLWASRTGIEGCDNWCDLEYNSINKEHTEALNKARNINNDKDAQLYNDFMNHYTSKEIEEICKNEDDKQTLDNIEENIRLGKSLSRQEKSFLEYRQSN